jgi:hypothetical protein
MRAPMLGMVGLAALGIALTSCSSGPEEKFPDQGAQHIANEQSFTGYNSAPPTSGPHWRDPAPWGIHSEPLPNEWQVHNLEHGGIMIQYNTEDQTLVTQLRRFAQKQSDFPCFLIVAPYPDMQFPVAVTAWGVRDTMESYDEARLQEFVDAYLNKGPERVPCS